MPRLQRSAGLASLGVRREGGQDRLETFFQSGAAKMRLPRVGAGEPLEAVLLNTAGGITGGDHLRYEVRVGAVARAIVTGQAAERIYRRSDGIATVENHLAVAERGELAWLPQETILFDRSALARRLTAEVAPDATLLMAESFVLGRAAMDETVRTAFVSETWRIRRGGRLAFADNLCFDGDPTAILEGGATARGARAFATIVLVAPDAEARLDAAREALSDGLGEGGASAWNGMLVARLRLIAPAGDVLRLDLVRLLEKLRGAHMPRVWHC
ncbi:MAG: urease accessory protein UreD [Rhizobiales bacterium]|nr:urease accessory protein UreD [Hyphomicrobiales bacterium]